MGVTEIAHCTRAGAAVRARRVPTHMLCRSARSPLVTPDTVSMRRCSPPSPRARLTLHALRSPARPHSRVLSRPVLRPRPRSLSRHHSTGRASEADDKPPPRAARAARQWLHRLRMDPAARPTTYGRCVSRTRRATDGCTVYRTSKRRHDTRLSLSVLGTHIQGARSLWLVSSSRKYGSRPRPRSCNEKAASSGRDVNYVSRGYSSPMSALLERKRA